MRANHLLFASSLAASTLLSLTACDITIGVAFQTGGAGGGGGAIGGSGGTGGAGGSGASTGTGGSGASSTGGSGGSGASSTGGMPNGGTGGTTGPVCGDGICEAAEQNTCPADCQPADCAHPTCEEGVALDPACSPCVAAICQNDAYCCDTAWDGSCANATNNPMFGCTACCGNGTCGAGENCDSCAADCGSCVCGDGQCLGETCESCAQDCGACSCGDGACTPGVGETCSSCQVDCGICQNCPHSACFAGAALDPVVCQEACPDLVCAMNQNCCTVNGWNAACQNLSLQLCPGNECIESVCAQNPSCCNANWTQACVELAKTTCNVGCDCAHSVCQDGEKMVKTCSRCVEDVCTMDPYCCDQAWDGICVDEAQYVCLIDCN